MNLVFGIGALFCIGWSMLMTNKNLNIIKDNDGSEKDIKTAKRSLIIVICVFIVQLLNVASMVIWR